MKYYGIVILDYKEICPQKLTAYERNVLHESTRRKEKMNRVVITTKKSNKPYLIAGILVAVLFAGFAVYLNSYIENMSSCLVNVMLYGMIGNFKRHIKEG